MRVRLILILLLSVRIAFAQIDVDYDGDLHESLYQADEYYITFVARGTEGVFDLGHTYIILETKGKNKNSFATGLGFYPTEDPTTETINKKQVVFSQVHGKLNEEWISEKNNGGSKKLRFKIDRQAYQKALQVIERWNDGSKKYSLGQSDCVSFVIDIGQAIGIDMPERGIFNSTPSMYLQSLIDKSIYPGSITIDNKLFSTDGYGHYFYGNQISYSSTFTGRYKYKDPSTRVTYEISYKNGNPFGPSLAIYENGDVWQLDRQILPNSTMFYRDGRIVSNYEANKAQFNGAISYPDGIYYIGQVSSTGVSDGYGMTYYTDGTSQYSHFESGKWIDDAPILYYGVNYTGKLKNNLFYGRGIIFFSNGDTYDGYFNGIDNKYHNSGRYVFSSGVVYEGQFNNGELNFAKIRFPNGDLYEGGVSNWQMHGNGSYYSAARNIKITGQFINNQLPVSTTGNTTSFVGNQQTNNNSGSDKPSPTLDDKKSGKPPSPSNKGGGNLDIDPNIDIGQITHIDKNGHKIDSYKTTGTDLNKKQTRN